MADERKCYAGDLSSDALGKTVVTPATHGEEARTGTVVEVVHLLTVEKPKRARTQIVFWFDRLGERRMVELDSNVIVEIRS
jgi:hypothetical protein